MSVVKIEKKEDSFSGKREQMNTSVLHKQCALTKLLISNMEIGLSYTKKRTYWLSYDLKWSYTHQLKQLCFGSYKHKINFRSKWKDKRVWLP